jgi:hypothetical protein
VPETRTPIKHTHLFITEKQNEFFAHTIYTFLTHDNDDDDDDDDEVLTPFSKESFLIM